MLRRQQIASIFAEALGTAVLTYAALAISKSAIGIPYFVALGVGLTQAVLIFSLGRTSGVHINPAVTFGLWTARKISSLRALIYIAAQFLGAAAALALFKYMLQGNLPPAQPIAFDWHILVAEMVGTAVFTFGIASALSQRLLSGALAAAVGGSLVVGLLIAGTAGSGIINPAVALGTQSWAKAFVVGPLVGALIGVNLFTILFAGENPVSAVKVSASRAKAKSRRKK